MKTPQEKEARRRLFAALSALVDNSQLGRGEILHVLENLSAKYERRFTNQRPQGGGLVMKRTIAIVFALGIVALALVAPATLRYPAATLGVVVQAAGGNPDVNQVETAWRTEVANDGCTLLTLWQDVMGIPAYDVDPGNRDANTPYPGGRSR